MEPNEPLSLDWKTCFKKILAPHLLNPTEEKKDAPYPVNLPKNQEQNDACRNVVNPIKDSVSTSAFLNKPGNFQNETNNILSSISVEPVNTGTNSHIYGCHDSVSPDGNLITAEREENVAADAEKLAKNFKALKVRKKDKNFSKMAKNSRNAPDWNVAFKKVLDPKYTTESSLETPEEFKDKPYSSNPELHVSWETNPRAFHRLCKKDEHWENSKEVSPQSSTKNCNKERHYTKEEKKVLEILSQAGTFIRPKKTHLNIFDGAGVNCFKNSEVKSSTKNTSLDSLTKKPRNVPPHGGWICIKPLTKEEIRKRPPNIITTECWDWDEDDW